MYKGKMKRLVSIGVTVVVGATIVINPLAYCSAAPDTKSTDAAPCAAVASSPKQVKDASRNTAIVVNVQTTLPTDYDLWGSGFREGFAAVYSYSEDSNNYFGTITYIDKNGHEIMSVEQADEPGCIECGGEGLPEFSEGLVRASKDDKWGYYDTSGNLVIPHKFGYAGNFKDGLAPVYDGDWFSETGKWCYIDKTGKIVITTDYDWVGEFSEGLAVISVRNADSEKYGYIDVNGNVVISPKYTYAESFSEGLAAVLNGDWCTASWGFIDKTDKVVVPFRYGAVNAFSDGLAAVTLGVDWDDWDFGYVDNKGNVAIPLTLDYAPNSFSDNLFEAPRFSEGLVALVEGEWGNRSVRYVDKTGRTVLAFNSYDDAREFSDGLSAVRNSATGKWGYIDKAGNTIVSFRYLCAGEFSDGLAIVASGDWDSLSWSVLAISAD